MKLSFFYVSLLRYVTKEILLDRRIDFLLVLKSFNYVIEIGHFKNNRPSYMALIILWQMIAFRSWDSFFFVLSIRRVNRAWDVTFWEEIDLLELSNWLRTNRVIFFKIPSLAETKTEQL